MRENVANTVYT